VIEPDVVLAARADKAPLDRLYDVLTDPPGPQADPAAELLAAPPPRIDPKFDADNARDAGAPSEIRIDELEASDRRPASGRLARFGRRVLMGAFLLTSAVGAAAWQHYGGDAKAAFAKWMPSFTLASSPAADTPAAAGQPAAPDATQVSAPVDSAALDKADKPSASAAGPSDVAVSATPPAAPVVDQDSTKLLQSMARDLASMNQQIDELKASIEQLKAGQAKLAQDAARAAETRMAAAKAAAEAKSADAKPQASNPRRRTAAPSARAAAALAHRPKQTFPYRPIPPAPATTRSYPAAAPVQLQPSMQAQATTTDGQPVLRPPMPLR
jgi:hypothetical protein